MLYTLYILYIHYVYNINILYTGCLAKVAPPKFFYVQVPIKTGPEFL